MRVPSYHDIGKDPLYIDGIASHIKNSTTEYSSRSFRHRGPRPRSKSYLDALSKKNFDRATDEKLNHYKKDKRHPIYQRFRSKRKDFLSSDEREFENEYHDEYDEEFEAGYRHGYGVTYQPPPFTCLLFSICILFVLVIAFIIFVSRWMWWAYWGYFKR